VGYKLPFLVLEEKNNRAAFLDGLKDYINEKLSPEERPNDIFVIDKKSISHFKTDKRFLQQKYGLL